MNAWIWQAVMMSWHSHHARTDQAATATFRTPPLFSRTIHARAVMLPYSGAARGTARGKGGKLSPMDGRTKIM